VENRKSHPVDEKKKAGLNNRQFDKATPAADRERARERARESAGRGTERYCSRER
jgi:hypothetical protein